MTRGTETDASDAPAPCPPWCCTSEEEHAQDDPDARVHEGPRFGMVRTWWVEGADDGFSASLSDDPEQPLGLDLGSEDLRHLATDALDAAMWIDRQSRSGPPVRDRSVVDLVREAHARATRSA